ncbi:MAG: SDR family oxidoreductase [Geodermatophilaceae bacterium]|nr:SDR family oxidoreductase [Geodermatophilaceae bacterium]
MTPPGDARTAVVTGAGSGIGAATTERLRAEGVRVAALDVAGGMDPGDWDGTGLLRCDVTDPASVDAAMGRVLAEFGRIDVLVNNAGITGSPAAGVLHETPIGEWDRVHAVNVRGPFLCSRAVLPAMIAQGSGHVITIASVAGLVAFPGRAAYSASKGAAVMLTRSIAVDYARHGIRANAICPGMVYTPMTAWRLDQPDLREQVERQIPMGRVADPAEIADAVALLAVGRLSYLNGHPLVLDGGMTAT